MILSSKDQFDGLMKLKKEIELIQFLKELDNQFKGLNNKFNEELKLPDEFEPEELKEEDEQASVTIPVYIESYILTVLNLGDSLTISDILTASSDEFSLEIDKVRAWLKEDKHQRDLLHVYFGGEYEVEETTTKEPKYSLTITSADQKVQMVVKDTDTGEFKVVEEGNDEFWLVDEFTPEELTDLNLGQLLEGDD